MLVYFKTPLYTQQHGPVLGARVTQVDLLCTQRLVCLWGGAKQKHNSHMNTPFIVANKET